MRVIENTVGGALRPDGVAELEYNDNVVRATLSPGAQARLLSESDFRLA